MTRPRPRAPLGAALGLALTALAACGSPGGGASSPVNTPPVVAIVSPADGAVLGGAGPFTLVGEAFDAEDGALGGGALTWLSSMDGVLGTGPTLSVPLSAGVHTFELTALDRLGALGRAAITVTVGGDNQPPAATISAPADGTAVVEGTALTFAGAGVDPEEGPLAGASLTWASDRDGPLGAGAEVTATLSVGAHVVTLTATDGQGATGSAAVGVTVEPDGGGPNQPPAPLILAPKDGASVVEGQALALSGEATDPEDGPLPAASLTWTSSLDGFLGTGSALEVPAPSLGAHVIRLTAIDSAGAAATAQVTVTVVPVGTDLPPVVTITSPAPGAAFTVGDPVALQGGADDPETGPLGDAALTWSSSLSGLLGTGASVVRDDLPAGAHVVTLTAVDPGGVSGSAKVTFTVNAPGNEPPTVTITAPADGAALPAGQPVALAATAVDPETGPLDGPAVAWDSSVDGALGVGAALTTAGPLTPGAHVLTVTATDPGGAVAVDQVAVTVVTANTPPQVTITAPAEGTKVLKGAPLTFAGTVVDAEQASFPAAALGWQSTLDGPLGTGPSLTLASLSVGAHTVTLTAVDAGGLVGSDAVGIVVEEAPVNAPPSAQLVGPASGAVGQALSFDGTGSKDSDGAVVAWSFDFGDGTAPATGGSAVAEHAFAAPGGYTVTLTVTDDDGATGAATHAVEIIDPGPVPDVVLDADATLGGACDVAVDAAGVAHVAFLDLTHPAVWYGTWDGEAASLELVDGMGYDVGAQVAGTSVALALGADGTPHLAYVYASVVTPRVRYARRQGAGWLREGVDGLYPASSATVVAVALDPSAGGRATVGYTAYDYDNPVVAWRTGAGAWDADMRADTDYDSDFTAGLAFRPDGTAWVSFNTDDRSLVTWSAAAGFGAPLLAYDDGSDAPRAPVVLDALGEPVLLHLRGIEHRIGGTFVHSDVEYGSLAWFDHAIDGSGLLYVAHRHGSDLEIARSESGDFWDRLYVGPMDAATPGVAVGADGSLAVCFYRQGNLLIYRE